MSDPIKKYVFSANFTVPDGFSPVFYSYAYGIMDGKEVEIMLQDDDCAERDETIFCTDRKVPVFPLLFRGESKYYESAMSKPAWIIDNDKNCWRSNSERFFPDENVETFILSVKQYGSNEAVKTVREILGIQTDEPEWVDKAREAGWVPPDRVRR